MKLSDAKKNADMKKFVFTWEYAITADSEETARELLELADPKITSVGEFYINEGHQDMNLNRIEKPTKKEIKSFWKAESELDCWDEEKK